jgi:peptidoglycan/LPS O-acetylase OafA/YrhL
MKLTDKSVVGRFESYRPDIDGLRALAVLAVIAFHGFPEYITGGFVGVDVFFVISGFLISGIILDETRVGMFSLQRFYARRVRRIFPALLLVLVVSLLAGWWLLLPADLLRLGKQLAASAAFVSNFYLWFQSSYFSPDAHTFPLLHLWSLGVEEQFYIVWPLIIIGLRRRPNWTMSAIVLIGISSFCLNVALIDNHEADFYSPVTRAWELMLGASLAWLRRRDDMALPSKRSADVATIAGLILILGSTLLFDQQSSYPGWLALVPTIGASLILWGGPNSGIARSILSTRALVFVGLISYPLYLWHWPLLVFSEAFKFAPLSPLERGLVIAVSFILAWLTYEFVESWFRAGRVNRAKIAALSGGMIFVAVAGFAIVEGQGFETRFPGQIREFAEVIGFPTSWRVHECLIDPKKETTFGKSCMEEARPLLFVWGDSTAAALMPGLRQLQHERNFGLAQFTANSCGPWLAVDIPGNPNCRRINDEVLGIVSRARPDVVVLHGRGSMRPEDIAGLKKTVLALRGLSIPHIVVLGPVPVWKRGLPNEVLRYFVMQHALIPARFSQRVYQTWNDAQMRSTLMGDGAEYISAWDAMCDKDGCLTRLGEKPEDLVASDQHHLTESGSTFIIQSIKDTIVPVGAPGFDPPSGR